MKYFDTEINKLQTWDEEKANGRWMVQKFRDLASRVLNDILWLPPKKVEFDYCLNVHPDTASALQIVDVLDIDMNAEGNKVGKIFGVPVYIDKELEPYSWIFGYEIKKPHRFWGCV